WRVYRRYLACRTPRANRDRHHLIARPTVRPWPAPIFAWSPENPAHLPKVPRQSSQEQLRPRFPVDIVGHVRAAIMAAHKLGELHGEILRHADQACRDFGPT